ncbi:MAG: glycosyltransferase [Gemmatimonadaceae bacterium]
MTSSGALPSVSVVVPVFNGAETIGDMLQALVTQSPVPEDMEIIVVDNGSTDGTAEIVSRFPQVLLLTESRRGPSAARNRGLRAARHELVLHCDADTLPSRRWVWELARCLAGTDAHIAAGKTLSYPPTTAAERYIGRAQMYEAEFNIARPVMPFAASMNMAVRRDSALEIRGWNEEMMTAEDVDFSTRLLARYPEPIRYAQGAVLFHRNRSSDAALRKQAWTYGEGAADTYRRYPSVVTWKVRQYLALVPTLAGRSLAPLWLRAVRILGMANEGQIEHARYHRMWTWWFWGGFFSFYRHGERRPMWSGEGG